GGSRTSSGPRCRPGRGKEGGMAASFLSRWFRGPQEADSAVESARAEIDRLAAARPDPAPVLGWPRDLPPDLATGGAAPPPLRAGRARAKLRESTPLLRDEPLTIDGGAFGQRWQRACAALEARQPDGAARALGEAMRDGRLSHEATVRAVLEGRPEAVRQRAEELGLDP